MEKLNSRSTTTNKGDTTMTEEMIIKCINLLNCNKEDIEVVIEETIKYLQDWCKRNGVTQ